MEASQQVLSPPAPPARRRSSWRRVVIPAIILVVGAVPVCLVAVMEPARIDAPPAEIPPVNVTTLLVQPIPSLADTFDLTATVEPNRIVRVAAEVSGRIERFGQRTRDTEWHGQVLANGAVIIEGEPIAAGDPLVYLNTDLLQARYDRAAAQFQYDQREYERILDLFERGNTSKTELDDARTRRDISRAALDEAARELERAAIVAPISGILNRLPMELGEFAAPGDTVAEIVEVDTVKVVADVAERDVGYLRPGHRVEVVPLVGGQPVLAGAITYINAVADEGTRTTRIEVTVDNRDERLRSGQIVKARLTRGVLENILMIPLASIIPLEDGKMVYVANGGRAERRDVELGFIKGSDVRILSGLEAGDRVIVSGHRYVGIDQPVNIIEER